MRPRPRSILLASAVMLILGAVFAVLRTPDRRPTTGAEVRPAVALGAEQGAQLVDAPLAEAEVHAPPSREEPSRKALVTETQEIGSKKAPRAAPDAEGPFLSGHLLDTNGFPVPNASITVSAKGSSKGLFGFVTGSLTEESTTSANGLFRVPRRQQSDGDVSVEIKARGFLVLREDRAPDAEKGDADLGTFELEAGVVLAGRVINSQGEPVAEAAVHRTTPEKEGSFEEMMAFTRQLQKDNPSWTETDAAGNFALENEQAGEYILLVQHKSYPKGRLEGITTTPGQQLIDLVVQLDPTGTISGRVRNYPGTKKKTIVRASPARKSGEEKPADMMSAMFAFAPGSGEATSEIEPDGSFHLQGLEVGELYTIQALQMGGFFDRAVCSDEQAVQTGTENVELVWIHGGRVIMRVVDASTSGPVHDISVRFSWAESGDSNMPNTTKKLKFEGPEAVLGELRPTGSTGELELIIEAPGYLAQRAQALNVALNSEVKLGTIRMKPAPTLRVRVVDAATGDPIKKARVALKPELPPGGDHDGGFEIVPGGERGRTDSDGWCSLPACVTATARLEVWKAGFVRYEREEVPMPTGERGEEVARLVKGGTIKLEVEDTSGRRVAGARIRHRTPDGNTRGLEASSNGKLRVKDLEPGEHAFTASRAVSKQRGSFRVRVGESEEDEEQWVTAGVNSGGTTALVLVIPAAASLHGEVTCGGVASAAARVTILPDRELSADEEINSRLSARFGNDLRARTDRRGKFRIAEVAVGPHRIRVTQPNGAPPFDVPFVIHEGENRVSIALPNGRISGFVLDSSGRPVPNATVLARRASVGEGDEETEQRRAITSALFGADRGQRSHTDADGSFVIEGVPEDVALIVEAGATGFVAGSTDEVTLTAGTPALDVRVHLTQSGSIRVRVEGATGPFIFVTAQYEGEEDLTHETSGALAIEGEAVLSDLAPGTWRVVMEREEETEGILVEVRPGQETFCTLIAE